MLVQSQPAFKGTVTAGPITEKTSKAQDGVMIGYVIALMNSGEEFKHKTDTDGKLQIEGLIKKIPFLNILTQPGFEDKSVSKELRKVSITLDKDTLTLEYNYPEYPKNNWFDTLKWKIDKEDCDKDPQAYKIYSNALKTSFNKLI